MPAAIDHRLIVAISSRALLTCRRSHAVCMSVTALKPTSGIQVSVNELLQPGVA